MILRSCMIFGGAPRPQKSYNHWVFRGQCVSPAENIVLVFQPPHGPELNPIERVWLFLKQHLAWQNCPSFDQLRQLVASELEAIAPERIASLTSYTFILEALFGATSY